MPKLRTAIIIVVAILAFTVGIFFLPTDRILSNIPYLNQFYNNTTVTITSRKGKVEVFLKDKSYGETPVTISDLENGNYTFKLVRKSDISDVYDERYIDIDLERNTEAIIDLEVGPENMTSGYILYYTNSPIKNDKGYISINSQPSDTSVYLDGDFTSRTPINALLANPKSYTIKLTKSGYEDLEFPAIVREGYNLNIRAFLFPIPIDINQIETAEKDGQ